MSCMVYRLQNLLWQATRISRVTRLAYSSHSDKSREQGAFFACRNYGIPLENILKVNTFVSTHGNLALDKLALFCPFFQSIMHQNVRGCLTHILLILIQILSSFMVTIARLSALHDVLLLAGGMRICEAISRHSTGHNQCLPEGST